MPSPGTLASPVRSPLHTYDELVALADNFCPDKVNGQPDKKKVFLYLVN